MKREDKEIVLWTVFLVVIIGIFVLCAVFAPRPTYVQTGSVPVGPSPVVIQPQIYHDFTPPPVVVSPTVHRTVVINHSAGTGTVVQPRSSGSWWTMSSPSTPAVSKPSEPSGTRGWTTSGFSSMTSKPSYSSSTSCSGSRGWSSSSSSSSYSRPSYSSSSYSRPSYSSSSYSSRPSSSYSNSGSRGWR